MPTAESQPEGELSFSSTYFAGTLRNTLTFQITPRLSGSFRYAIISNWGPVTTTGGRTYDRSFDARFQLVREGKYRPAVAIGAQDIIGTGIYSGEYVVATKHVTPAVKVTGGIGWGRFGSNNSFANPLAALHPGFATRSAGFGLGGVPVFGNWFRGPAALFAGVEWQTPVKGLAVKAELSSDAYTLETVDRSIFNRRSSLNFALDYVLKNGTRVSGYYLYGSELGLRVTVGLNPKKPKSGGSVGAAPPPVVPRPKGVIYKTEWTEQADVSAVLRANMKKLFKAEGLELVAFSVDPYRAEVRFRNLTHDIAPEAIGRLARLLTQIMPDSVETFVLVPMVKGLATVAITILRSDLEALEHDVDGAEQIFARARFQNAPAMPAGEYISAISYPDFTWSVKPHLQLSLFDPDNPARFDVGIKLEAKAEVRPGLVFSGALIKKIFGNLNENQRVTATALATVRSDVGLYHRSSNAKIEFLTAEYFFQPGTNLYGRVTIGYLEQAFGGVSAEMLWQPVNSSFAIGVEVNFAQKRDYVQLFGFQAYNVVTGHVSAYWDMGNGFTSQVDVGRYLAGDVGATVTIDRAFDNGWKVGAFFTLTNVPFATFGEGSFDKGLRFVMPVSWFSGVPRTETIAKVVRPILRDGGAKLDVPNRLYGLVSDYHGDRLQRRWGRFWR